MKRITSESDDDDDDEPCDDFGPVQSSFYGVTWDRREGPLAGGVRLAKRLGYEGQVYNIGMFDHEQQAARVDAFVRKYMPEKSSCAVAPELPGRARRGRRPGQPGGRHAGRAERAGTRRGRVRRVLRRRPLRTTRGPPPPADRGLRLRHGPAAATRAHGK